MASLNRERDRWPPTAANDCRERSSSSRSRAVSSPAAGIVADVAGRERDRAVHQVAPGRHQLVVVTADELGPGEVRVLVLRAGHRHVVPQRVDVVALEEVADVDDDVARGGELPALHGQVLAGDDLGWQVQRAEDARRTALGPLAVVAEQHRRPDLGVEDDVVLAHEVVRLGVRRLPPGPPGIGVARAPAPIRSTRTGSRRPRRTRRRSACRAGHASRPAAPGLPSRDPACIARGFRSSSRLSENLSTFGRHWPLLLCSQVPSASAKAGRSRKKCSVLDELRRLAVDPRPRADQVDRVQLVAAVVALVAAGARRTRRSGRCPRCTGRAACARSTARSHRGSSSGRRSRSCTGRGRSPG